ncbi:MAG: phospholipase D-like domain-containing protein, partial [Chitinophagaceae bacterium]
MLYDTRSSTKALAYILFIVFVPIAGMIFYFSFGINYRKQKLYSRKIIADDPLRKQIKKKMDAYSGAILHSGLIADNYKNLIEFIRRAGNGPPTVNNAVKLLINGEEKFLELKTALENAKSHIHLEYYIYEGDITGNDIAEQLIKKAKQGVEVRFMYDDFGSHGLDKSLIRKLKDAGVQTAAFYKITWYALANRLNYRNHRKIIIIDGETGFIGGINISDKYRNDLGTKNKLFWRDTHLMIKGPASAYLQYLFMCDWNFCSQYNMEYSEAYFPIAIDNETIDNEVVQIAASGPDSTQPVIFYS